MDLKFLRLPWHKHRDIMRTYSIYGFQKITSVLCLLHSPDQQMAEENWEDLLCLGDHREKDGHFATPYAQLQAPEAFSILLHLTLAQ